MRFLLKEVTLCLYYFSGMDYIKSLGVIILMIHLIQTQQVTHEEVLEGDQGGQYTSIDNDNLYTETQKVKAGAIFIPSYF